VESLAGAAMKARHEIELAATAADQFEDAPEWLDFFNRARLESFAGYAALSSEDTAEAAAHLGRALDGPTDTDRRQAAQRRARGPRPRSRR
jgi:hypothetical protein